MLLAQTPYIVSQATHRVAVGLVVVGRTATAATQEQEVPVGRTVLSTAPVVAVRASVVQCTTGIQVPGSKSTQKVASVKRAYHQYKKGQQTSSLAHHNRIRT